MADDGTGGDPKRNGEGALGALAAVRRDEAPPAVFASAGTTEAHVEAIRAELAARGVPKSEDALEAILVIDAEVMSRQEFAIALKVARDRGVVEHVDGGYVAVE